MNDLKKMCILIVDDTEDNLILMRAILEEEGYENIATLTRAKEACRLMENQNIDLVLLDIMMPEIDGLTACRTIKEKEIWKDIPVIIITAKVDNRTLKESFDCGANDYIKKPINEVEMLARVKSALTLKSEMDLRKEKEQKLEEESITDPLTGLYNRRYMDLTFNKEIKRTKREKTHLSFLMMDIDCFKQYNDTYGHQAGDEVLKEVAHVLKKEFKRPGDFVARYGGEEFAAFFTGLDEEQSINFAEQIRVNIESLKMEHKNNKAGSYVTLSMGLAVIDDKEEPEEEEIIKRADQALYKAKESGRNRVVVRHKT